MEENKFGLLNVLGYILVIGVVTAGLIYAIRANYMSKINLAQNPQTSQNTTMNEELKHEDVVVGKGAEAVSGKEVTVHYTGTLEDGTKFDSSRDEGREPYVFTLGAGEVIEGWDTGIVGMKVGGKRKLTIPGSMGYGPAGTPDGRIPPNATLLFEVELLNVK